MMIIKEEFVVTRGVGEGLKRKNRTTQIGDLLLMD